MNETLLGFDEPTIGPNSLRLAYTAQRWQTTGLMANFIAEYVRVVFPRPPEQVEVREDICDSVSFVTNELLENATKYSHSETGVPLSGEPIRLEVLVDPARVALYVTNPASSAAADALREFAGQLATGSPDAMYLEQMASNANVDSSSESGLGYLSIVNDHGARLAWKLSSTPSPGDVIRVTTMAEIRLTESGSQGPDMAPAPNELKGEGYRIVYDSDDHVVACEGSFRLRGTEEYAPIFDLLTRAAEAKPSSLTLDLRALQFLNSSGINTLSKFVLLIRRLEATQLNIKGAGEFPWQKKSLRNFERLLPGLSLTYE
ncbi:MAG: hypothetical protein AAF493_04915 [Pseudomonadota bacterium]